MTEFDVLLVNETSEGQTHKIAERIATRLEEHGLRVDLTDSTGAPRAEAFRAVVAGDPIHLGRHTRALRTWLSHNASALAGRTFGLFQVSLTSASDDPDDRARVHAYLDDLVDEIGVEPDVVGLFAGALRYTRYGWITKRVMRRIAGTDGFDTDTSRDHEYTDWDAVDAFADDVAALLGARDAVF